MAQAFKDFSGYSTGAIGSVSGGDFSVQVAGGGNWTQNCEDVSGTKMLRITRTSSGTAGNLVVCDALGAATSGDIEVVVKMRRGANPDSAAIDGPTLSDSSGNSYGIAWGDSGGQFQLGRWSSLTGSPTQIGSDFGTGIGANTWFWVRLGRSGTTIRAKAWADGSGEPGSWQTSGTDTNITSVKAGFACAEYQWTPYDCGAFGVGTGGDAAPTSGGGLVTQSGLASAAAYGSHAIANTVESAQPSGIATSTVYGSHTLSKVAARTLGPVGNLSSSALYGSHSIASSGAIQYVQPSGIGTSSAFGTHALAKVAARSLGPVGNLGSAAVYGTQTAAKTAASEGIPSAVVYGTHQIASQGTDVIGHQGKSSAAVYGSHTVAKVAAQVVPPAGNSSAAVYGSHALTISGVAAIAPSGLVSPAIYGAPTVALANKLIGMTGISSAGIGGIPKMLGGAAPTGNGMSARCRWRRSRPRRSRAA